ncbi:MAG: hypothetical protein QXG39_01880 [Candidatus Aenigmatarchaeota archaeon]
MPDTIAQLEYWKPDEQHVDKDIDPSMFLSSDNVLICSANTKEYKSSAPINVVFVGLAERFTFNSAQAVQTIYEIGSSLAYYIVGQTRHAATIDSIYFQGPDLLYRLYSANDEAAKRWKESGVALRLSKQGNRYMFNEAGDAAFILGFSDEESTNPIGVCVFFRFKNGPNVSIGGYFLENCIVSTKAMTVGAGALMMMDSVAMSIESIKPIYPQVP